MIEEKIIDVKCVCAEKRLNNLYDCLYLGKCISQLDFGNSYFCREEIKKPIYIIEVEQ